jgi:hypothetical protein
MNLVELPSDILSKIFNYNLDDIEANIEKLEKQSEIIQLINEITYNRISFIFDNDESEFALKQYNHRCNNINTKILLHTDLFNIIETHYKIRLIMDIGKSEYMDDEKKGLLYLNKYGSNVYVSPILYLARYLDAFILAIKIHNNAYKDDKDINALLEVLDVVWIDDLKPDYDEDELNSEPDIMYYAIVY